MTRDDLLALISRAIRRNTAWINEPHADAIADTILREMRAAGLRIFRRRG